MKWRNFFRAVAALLLVGIVLAFGVDLRPWRALDLEVRTDLHAAAPLRAGAGKAPVDLPEETPLAGFRPFGRKAEKEGGPVFARTLLLEAGGVRTGVVLLELMSLPASLVERIEARLQAEGIACALVAASHTHTGPGAYDRDLLPQAVAIGRFDARVEQALLDAVGASLAAAERELAPGRLFAGEGRVRIATNRDRPGHAVDDRLDRIEVRRPDGAPVATLLRASAHPTIADRDALSGDWPGVVMAGLEGQGGVAFVLQGAAGDAVVEGERDARVFGQRVLDAAGSLALAAIDEPPILGCRKAGFALPPPDLSAVVPRPLGRFATNLAIPLAPERSQVVALRLGDRTLLGVPGEPTAAVGQKLEAKGGRVRTVGLVGGYAGYLVEGPEMRDRVFSARNAWFGDVLTDRIVQAAERLLVEAPVPSENRWSEEASVP